MLMLMAALFAVSWFPFFTAHLILDLQPDHVHRGHRSDVITITIAVLQLLGYRSLHRWLT